MSELRNKRKGVGFALLAAGMFGLSTPLAKSVSPHVEPVLLAGLLYLGSGLGWARISCCVSVGGKPARAKLL